jgi:hypothetical protein
VGKVSIESFRYIDSLQTIVSITVSVSTSSTDSVTLTIVFAGSEVWGKPGAEYPDTRIHMLSGQTLYEVTDKAAVTNFACPAFIGALVTTKPADMSGSPNYVQVVAPPPC